MKKDSILRENNCSQTESARTSVQFSEIEERNYAQGQISENIFKAKWRLYVYHPLNIK